MKETKRDKTNIGVGTSVAVKVELIDEKIREGKIRSMRKELVGWMQYSMVFLWLTTEVYINRLSDSLQLHFYAAVILYCCNYILLQMFSGCLIAFGVRYTSSQTISCSSLLKKMEMKISLYKLIYPLIKEERVIFYSTSLLTIIIQLSKTRFL